MVAPDIDRLRAWCEDPGLGVVRQWQARHPGAPVVGYLPGYCPRELIYAAGGLAVGLWGVGPGMEIVQGDASYQSYICRLPRGVLEQAHQGVFADFRGLIFPSSCDVIRNLSGIWRLQFPAQWAFYLDLPQAPDGHIAGPFLRGELERLASLILGGPPDQGYRDRLREAIGLTNRQAAALRRLRGRRRADPPAVPIDDYLWWLRGALVLHPAEHLQLLESYLDADRGGAPSRDQARVLLVGAFCEQPPPGLLKTIEQAGCDIVDDDLLLGLRWFETPLREDGDPIASLAAAYLGCGAPAPFRYQGESDRGAALVRRVRETGAGGVLFAAPSFCDPALLERPRLQDALRAAGIPFTGLTYAEDAYQPQALRELAGTFSDSIRLWDADD